MESTCSRFISAHKREYCVPRHSRVQDARSLVRRVTTGPSARYCSVMPKLDVVTAGRIVLDLVREPLVARQPLRHCPGFLHPNVGHCHPIEPAQPYEVEERARSDHKQNPHERRLSREVGNSTEHMRRSPNDIAPSASKREVVEPVGFTGVLIVLTRVDVISLKVKTRAAACAGAGLRVEPTHHRAHKTLASGAVEVRLEALGGGDRSSDLRRVHLPKGEDDDLLPCDESDGDQLVEKAAPLIGAPPFIMKPVVPNLWRNFGNGAFGFGLEYFELFGIVIGVGLHVPALARDFD